MNFLLCFLVILHLSNAETIPWTKLSPPTHNPRSLLYSIGVDSLWKQFLNVFKYNASNSSYEVFHSNIEKIFEQNIRYRKNETLFEMGINAFSAMNHSQYQLRLGFDHKMRAKSTIPRKLYSASLIALPTSIDWREKGLVTPVKDQGSCKSCWAFSATGSVEGQFMHQSGKLLSLSEQQLVDCSGTFSNAGCAGGLMDNAFAYVEDVGGIETEKDYPYSSGYTRESNKNCYFNKSKSVVRITSYVDIESGNVQQLKEALVTRGPISIAINGGRSSFMFYKSGIYDDVECDGDMESLNHGVLLVGYGVERGVQYWIIKNSYGEKWGESGYIRIKIHKNMCGVATMPSYPLVSDV